MGRIALVAIGVAGIVLVSTAGAEDELQKAPPGGFGVGTPYGTLQVREDFDSEGGVPIEGYVSFVVVKKAGSGKVVLRAEPPFSGPIHRGLYRVSSFMRTCSANCGYLDPPSNRCATRFNFAGGITKLTIRRLADRPCEFRVR
jgi:hypothetical protein